MLSYSVSERTKEIGLRLALGASGGDTVALVMRRSVALVAVGGVVGLVAARAAGAFAGRGALRRRARSTCRRLRPRRPCCSLAGVIASLLPALRTARVDPMVALRES